MNRRAKYSRKYNSLVVCALAYAIAIQAALLAYVAATNSANAGSLFAQLCAQQSRGDVPAAPSHNPDMLCCLAASLGAAAAPPERSAIVAPDRSIVAGFAEMVLVDRFVGWP